MIAYDYNWVFRCISPVLQKEILDFNRNSKMCLNGNKIRHPRYKKNARNFVLPVIKLFITLQVLCQLREAYKIQERCISAHQLETWIGTDKRERPARARLPILRSQFLALTTIQVNSPHFRYTSLLWGSQWDLLVV